jgi:dihydrodipicolinate reductase
MKIAIAGAGGRMGRASLIEAVLADRVSARCRVRH